MPHEITIRIVFFITIFALVALGELLAPRRSLTTSKKIRWVSNFGFNLPWWDRLFGTYNAQPSKGHTDMTIGLAQYRNIKKLMFHHLLLLPFTGDTGRQPINRH